MSNERSAEEEKARLEKYLSRYKLNSGDHLWNKDYCPIQAPRPALPPQSIRLDEAGPPGRWVWLQNNSKGVELMMISRLYYAKDDHGNILRNDANRGEVKEALTDKVQLTEAESKNLLRYLVKHFEGKGYDVKTLLDQKLVEY